MLRDVGVGELPPKAPGLLVLKLWGCVGFCSGSLDFANQDYENYKSRDKTFCAKSFTFVGMSGSVSPNL